MTSPAAILRCTACGATRRAISGADLAHVAPGHASQARPALCRGVWVDDIARDDRAGVTLPLAIQPVGGYQLVAAGPGRGDQLGDRGHGDSIATASAPRDVNRALDAGPAGSVDFTERNHA